MKLILYFSTCLTYSYKFRLIFAPKQIHRVHFSYMLESCWIILKQTKTHIEASRQCRLISWCCCCSAYCTQPLQQKPGFVWVGRVHVYASVVYNRCEKKPPRVQEDKYVEQSDRQSRAIDISGRLYVQYHSDISPLFVISNSRIGLNVSGVLVRIDFPDIMGINHVAVSFSCTGNHNKEPKWS